VQGTNSKDATMKLFPCARNNHTALPFHWIGVPAFAALLAACGGGANDAASTAVALGAGPSGRTIAITPGSDVIAYWSQIAADTVNIPAAATGTPEERRPIYNIDLATVHVAMFDAVNAIDGSYRRFAAQPTTATAGASLEAAAAAAAYHTLKGLFPNRTTQYEAAYVSYVAAILDGDAKTRGLQIGQEVATQIVALRADDGRFTPVTYTPTSLPGRFRGTNPVNTFLPFVRPFTLQSASQFRADGPPPLTSAEYAADVNETKAMGAANSTIRTAEQTEIARFHTEPPPRFWPRNLRIFATADRGIAENARTLAALWTAQADALITCFESKYLLAAIQRDSARRHRRQRGHRRRSVLGAGRADTQPSRIPGRPRVRYRRGGRGAGAGFRHEEAGVRLDEHRHGDDAPLRLDRRPRQGNPGRPYRRRHALPHVHRPRGGIGHEGQQVDPQEPLPAGGAWQQQEQRQLRLL